MTVINRVQIAYFWYTNLCIIWYDTILINAIAFKSESLERIHKSEKKICKFFRIFSIPLYTQTHELIRNSIMCNFPSVNLAESFTRWIWTWGTKENANILTVNIWIYIRGWLNKETLQLHRRYLCKYVKNWMFVDGSEIDPSRQQSEQKKSNELYLSRISSGLSSISLAQHRCQLTS